MSARSHAHAYTYVHCMRVRTQEMFRRSQLMALVDLHGRLSGFGGSLTEAEVLVIKGALDLTAKTASKSMTPLDKVGVWEQRGVACLHLALMARERACVFI